MNENQLKRKLQRMFWPTQYKYGELIGEFPSGPVVRNRLPRWLSGKESACQCRRLGFDSWSGKIPWGRKCQPTPVFLLGKSHGQRRLAGYSPRGHKESDETENRSRVIRKQFGNKPMQFSSVQSLSRVQLFATPQTTAHQASLSITNFWSVLKLMPIAGS